MVCGITAKKNPGKELERLQTRFQALRASLTQAFQDDAAAFDGVMAAFSLPKGTDDEKAKRRAAIEEATKRAAHVPLSVAKASLETVRLLTQLAGLAGPNVASDVTVAVQMARASIVGAVANVRINLDALKDAEFVSATRGELNAIERQL